MNRICVALLGATFSTLCGAPPAVVGVVETEDGSVTALSFDGSEFRRQP